MALPLLARSYIELVAGISCQVTDGSSLHAQAWQAEQDRLGQ
jgi:hypothetical protein